MHSVPSRRHSPMKRIALLVVAGLLIGATAAHATAGRSQHSSPAPASVATTFAGGFATSAATSGGDDPATHDAGDDNGVDDPATHGVGDDNGADDPATHDAGDDNGGDQA